MAASLVIISHEYAVDAKSLGLADYLTIVQQPMDLSLVAAKLDKRKYKLLKQVT
jgi:hypothetical protein